MRPYCIENRAKKQFGTTEIFEFAGYLLTNGEMLNFSYGGHQRDEDHRIIGSFFKKATGYDAVVKFMKRGNIRVMCCGENYCFEFIKHPTVNQINMLRRAAKDAEECNYAFYIEKSNTKGRSIKSYYDISDFLYYEGGVGNG